MVRGGCGGSGSSGDPLRGEEEPPAPLPAVAVRLALDLVYRESVQYREGRTMFSLDRALWEQLDRPCFVDVRVLAAR